MNLKLQRQIVKAWKAAVKDGRTTKTLSEWIEAGRLATGQWHRS